MTGDTSAQAFLAGVLAIACVVGIAYTLAAAAIDWIVVRLDRGDPIRIADVPCGSCQVGYGGRHSCDIPDYCPCDHTHDHVRTTR